MAVGSIASKYLIHELSYVPEIKDDASWLEGYQQLRESAARGEHEVGVYVSVNRDNTLTWHKPLKGDQASVAYGWDNFLRAEVLLALGKNYERVGQGHTHTADRVTRGPNKGTLLIRPNPPSLNDIRGHKTFARKAGIPLERYVDFVVDSAGNLRYYRDLEAFEVPALYQAALDDYLVNALDFVDSLGRHIARNARSLRRTYPAIPRIDAELTTTRRAIGAALTHEGLATPDATIARDRAVRRLAKLVTRDLGHLFPPTPNARSPFRPFVGRYDELLHETHVVTTRAPERPNGGARLPAGAQFSNLSVSASEERAMKLAYLKEHALVRLVRPADVSKEPPCAGPDYFEKPVTVHIPPRKEGGTGGN